MEEMEIWDEPMLCGSGVVFRLVAVWHGGCALAGKRGGYGGILVRGGRDVIPGIVGPDVVVVGQEPGLAGKRGWSGRNWRARAGTFLEPKGFTEERVMVMCGCGQVGRAGQGIASALARLLDRKSV
jgi:hypothetical protein